MRYFESGFGYQANLGKWPGILSLNVEVRIWINQKFIFHSVLTHWKLHLFLRWLSLESTSADLVLAEPYSTYADYLTSTYRRGSQQYIGGAHIIIGGAHINIEEELTSTYGEELTSTYRGSPHQEIIVFVQGGSPTPHPFSSRPHFVCKLRRQRSTKVF